MSDRISAVRARAIGLAAASVLVLTAGAPSALADGGAFFEYNVILKTGDPLPGLAANFSTFRHVSLNQNGQFVFGGLSSAATNRDILYKGSVSPFSLDLVAFNTQSAPGSPGFTHGTMRSAVGINDAGDTAFISRLQPGNLDTLHLNGSRFVGAPDTIEGDALGIMFHAQIDGAGTPWAVAALGATTATNRALIRGNAVELRKGGVVDGVTIIDIVTSEATAGSKLRVNNAGDYIVEITGNTGGANHKSLIFNGQEVARQGESVEGLGTNNFIDHVGVTPNGTPWWSVELNAFNGPRHLVFDGAVVAGTGDDLGGGLSLNRTQTVSFNSGGNWLAGGSLLGASGTNNDTALIYNGKIMLREGDAALPGFTWSSFGFVNDLHLADDGDFLFVGTMSPVGGGSTIDVLVAGTVPAPGAATLLALGALAGARRRRPR